MNMSWIDWAIVITGVVLLRLVSLSTCRYMKGVADFLSANRSAGRYLLTIASSMAGVGVITFIAGFEMAYEAGISPQWWAMMGIPLGLIIMLTGWVFYRFRETRAMTMAQYFEMRYSRRFRIFAGSLCWISGVINFGIFPAVAARFFIYFCGLPVHYHIPGIPWEISTFATVMLIDLGIAVWLVTMGGQVTIMVTDCVQGMFCTAAFVVVGVVTSGFYSAARSPHEQKMGGIIGLWRSVSQIMAMALIPLAALVVMRLPEFSGQAALVNETLQTIDNERIQGQMVVPIAMAHFLPIGVKGLLATIFLFFSFTCHDTYMHSWGTIFIQDVYIPIRKKVLSPEQHIKLLRWSIIGVAVFAFLFSLLYQQTEKIYMYQAITGTIWAGGSGVCIFGGLYWKRGTAAAAYCALIVGAILGVGGLIVGPIYESHYGQDFPINGQWLWFIAMIVAMALYFVVSLLTSTKEKFFNLERLLNRGKYAKSRKPLPDDKPRSKWLMITGITDEFSRSDAVLAIALVLWHGLHWAWFALFSIINLIFPISNAAWGTYWHIHILSYLVLSIPATIWFTVGGIIDIRSLFRILATAKRDVTDDGRVLTEVEMLKAAQELEAVQEETAAAGSDSEPD